MSAIQEAAANTVFRIANLYEQNCALKHGLPKVGGPDRIKMEEPEQKPDVAATIAAELLNKIPAATAATNSPSPGLGAVAETAKRSLISRAAPFLLTAAIPGAGALGWAFASKQSQPAPATQQSPEDGSLLQYLQDQGQHLPEGAWPTK